MKNTGNPYSVGKAPVPKAGEDYTATSNAIRDEQEEASKAPPELPYALNSFPQRLGTMLAQLFEMRDILNVAANEESLKDKRVDHQQEQLEKIIEGVIELNNSMVDLKL